MNKVWERRLGQGMFWSQIILLLGGREESQPTSAVLFGSIGARLVLCENEVTDTCVSNMLTPLGNPDYFS